MADYGSKDGVRAHLLGGLIIEGETEGSPNSAHVATEVSAATAQVNVVFKSAGIPLPVADPDVLTMLAALCDREATYQVAVIRSAVKDSAKTAEYLKWHDEFLTFLKEVKKNGVAGLTSSLEVPWSFTRDADVTDPSDPRNPIFQREYVE